MTTVIDERVVEMRFNNEDFEKNVAQSLSTLDKLKDALKFEEGSNALENIGKASSKFSLSGITETITEATSKFSALEVVGIGALANLGAKAVDFGIKFVKSLSIDQISEGFKKYADKTTAVQTIIASTGLKIDEVEKSMERLNWFTDETSYNFVDMVNNIGKFTSAGIELDKAQSAMQGIANWAARSGQDATTASRAMYNFAQAMGAGAMKLQDWKSIENANMATMEFKQTALETAAELGKLKKVADGVYTTLDGKTEVTAKNFSESLKKKWFDADVMIETLNRYNSYADELYALSEKTGRTASQLMIDADDYANGTLDIKRISESTGVSVEELAKAYESLNSETNKLSREAFKNAQEAKTFKEVMDATADAVSTGWMNTFQLIFGNYEEAKALWTGLANTLVDVFTKTGTARNEILGFWKDLGGRESLIRGLVQMLNLIVKPLSAIGRAFTAVMPGTKEVGTALANATNAFEAFMNKLQPSQETLTAIYTIFKGLFSIIKTIGSAIGYLLGIMAPAGNIFATIIQAMGTVITYVAAFLHVIVEYAKEMGVFETISNTISTVLGTIIGYIKQFVSVFGSGIVQGIGGFIMVIFQAVSTLAEKSSGVFSVVIKVLTDAFNTISSYISKFASTFDGSIFQKIGTFVTFIIDRISAAGAYIATFVKSTNVLEFAINKIVSAFEFLKAVLTSLFAPAEKATTVVKKMEANYSGAATVTAEFGTLTRDAADDIQESTAPISLMASLMQKLGNTVKLVGLIVGGIGVLIGKAISGIFSLFNKNVTATSTSMASFADSTENGFRKAIDPIEMIRGKLQEFYDSLAGGKFDIAGTFQKIGSGILNFIGDLDEGKVAAIALSIGLLAIIRASIKLSKQVGEAATSVTGVAKNISNTIAGVGGAIKGTFQSITSAIDSFAKRSKVLTVVKTFATAFAMVAASLTILSLVPTDKLLIVSGIMAGFIVIFTVLTGVVISLAKKLNQAKFQVSFRQMSKTILLLASSIAVLGLAISILAAAKLEGGIEEFAAKIGAAIVMLAALVAACVALSKFSKTLPKGAVLLLAMAVAMRQLALAVKEFAYMPVDNINDHWGTYIAIFAGLSLVMAAAGHVKVTSALALLALAKSMSVILPAINQIVNMAKELPYDSICKAASDNVGSIFLFLMGLVTVLMFTIALIEASNNKLKKAKTAKSVMKGGGIFSGIGGALVGIGVGIALIVASIKSIHKIYSEFQEGELKDIVNMFATLTIVMGAITAFLIWANKKVGGADDKGKTFSRMALLFVGLGLAMRIMASALKAMSTIEDMGKAWQAVAMISILMAVMATVVGVSGTVPKALPAIAAIMSAVIAIGFLLGELAILSIMAKNPDIWLGVGILAGIFIALNVTMRSLEKIQNVKAGPIFALVATIVAMSASLILLSKLNFIKVLSSAAAMSMVMLALGHMFKIISKITMPSWKQMIGISVIVAEMAALAIPLYFLAQQDWTGVLAAGGALSLAILALAGVLKILQKVEPPKLTTVAALFALVVSLGLLAVPLYFLAQQDWKSIAAATGGLSLTLLAMTAALAILSKLGSTAGQVAAAASLVLVAGSLIIVAQALNMLKDIDVGEAAAKVGAILGIMSGIILVFGLISSIPAIGQGFAIGMLAFSAAIIAMSLAFSIFALALTPLAEGLTLLNPALEKFATIDFVSIATGLTNLAEGLKAIGFAGIIVGIGAIGLALLAAALYALGLAAGASYENLNNLAAVPMIDIALGLAAIGAVGAIMGIAAPLIIAGAVAIGIFSAALLVLNVALQGIGQLAMTFGLQLNIASLYVQLAVENIKNTFKNLFSDLKTAFSGSEANGVVKAAAALGAMIGGGKHPDTGLIGGIAKVLGWHSIPDEILKLLSDVGLGFSSDTEAASAAGASGEKIGDSFGSRMASKISGWLSGIGSGVSGFFNNLSGGSVVISSMGSDLDSTGAQAEKFGKEVKNTTKEMNLFDQAVEWGKEKLGDAKEEVGDIIGLDPGDFISDFTETMEEATKGAGDFSESLDGVGESAGKAGKGVKGLADTLRSGLDLFSKFEVKNEMTSQQLLENMKSNIDGYASWSHRMTVLAKRFADNDIPVSLLEKLKEDGPKQQDVMNAIYNMTDEELAELRELYATGMALPESQAAIIGDAFTYMGEMATKGFSNALDEHDAAHAAAHGLGEAAVEGLSEALEVNSPSKVTERIGNYLVEGLVNGLDSVYGQGILYFAVKHVCSYILELFNTNLSEEAINEISTGVLTSLFSDILNGNEEDNPVMGAFVESLSNYELLDEALILFQEHIIEMFNRLFEMESSEERSELFFRYAQSWLQSIVDSLIFYEFLVLTQVRELITHLTDTIEEADLPGAFYEIGSNLPDSMARGILENLDVLVAAAVRLAEETEKATTEALEVNSPSKVFRRIGHSIPEGMVLGIEDGAQHVYNAASSLAESGISGMEDNMGKIQSVINSGIDLNPLITPMLDLTYLQSQMDDLNGMFADDTYDVNAQNRGGSFTGQPTQVNFTQNNYSPKALSRIDIYRQTKNQVSMMKGVMAANA